MMTKHEKEMLLEILREIGSSLDELAHSKRVDKEYFRLCVEDLDKKYEVFREYVKGKTVTGKVA